MDAEGETLAAQPSRRTVVTKVDIYTTRCLTDHIRYSCSLQEWQWPLNSSITLGFALQGACLLHRGLRNPPAVSPPKQSVGNTLPGLDVGAESMTAIEGHMNKVQSPPALFAACDHIYRY